MGAFAGPEIAESGLVLALDAGNTKGYDNDENLLTYSEDISQNHFNENVSISTNQITSPDGTTTADKLTSTITGGTNTCHVQKFSAVSIDTATYTFSVFLKAGTSPQTLINLQLGGGTYQQSRATINWTSNTITSSDGGTSALTSYPNGWYRVSITLTNNGTNNAIYPRVYVRGQGTDNVNGEYVYVWGMQVEKGSVATDYTPTTTTAKNRGTTLIDMSGRGNNGTLVTYPNYSNDANGSILFNSTGPYIQLNQNSYDITDAYTVSFWVKRISGTGVFLYIGQSSTTGMYFESYTNTDLYTWFFGANSPQNNGNWGANALSTTQWVNVVMTMVTSTKTQTRYLNGTISGSPFVFTNAVTAPSAVNWLIKNNSQNWSGYISDLKLYNRALTAQEIQQNFNATRSRFSI